MPDCEMKKSAYGFIKTTFRQLRDDEKKWSEILREDRQLVDAEKICVYCGAAEHPAWDYIVPRSLAINERGSSCDRIQGIHKKYLKTIYYCHDCRGTLDWEGNGDGLSVLDLDL